MRFHSLSNDFFGNQELLQCNILWKMGDHCNRYHRYQFGNQPPWGNAYANDPLSVYVQNEEKMDKARKRQKKLVGGGRKRKGADSSSESGSDKPKLSNKAAKRLANAIEVQNAQKASLSF